MLRELTTLDFPSVVAIEKATQLSPWSEETFAQCALLGTQGWVIELNQRVIGFILLFSKVGEGHILNLGVHPDYQRQGYGQQLLSQVMLSAKQDDLFVLFLEVRVSNEKAIALYKKLGFKQIGIRKDYYPDAEGREDALVYAYHFANNVC